MSENQYSIQSVSVDLRIAKTQRFWNVIRKAEQASVLLRPLQNLTDQKSQNAPVFMTLIENITIISDNQLNTKF